MPSVESLELDSLVEGLLVTSVLLVAVVSPDEVVGAVLPLLLDSLDAFVDVAVVEGSLVVPVLSVSVPAALFPEPPPQLANATVKPVQQSRRLTTRVPDPIERMMD